MKHLILILSLLVCVACNASESPANTLIFPTGYSLNQYGPYDTPVDPGGIIVPASQYAYVEVPPEAKSVQVTVIQFSTVLVPVGYARVAHKRNFAEVRVYDPRDYPDFMALAPHTDLLELGNSDPSESLIYSVTFSTETY